MFQLYEIACNRRENIKINGKLGVEYFTRLGEYPCKTGYYKEQG